MGVMTQNFAAMTDFYKFCHWLMYPANVTRIYSYCEPRNGAELEEIKFVGIIPLIREFFEGTVITKEKVDEAQRICEQMGGQKAYFNRKMWDHIIDKYDGKLPLVIKALPEGTVVKPGTPLFSIDSPDPICMPLVGHAETILMHVWGMTTIASVGHYLMKEIKARLITAGMSPEEAAQTAPFMVHDFGYRGVSSDQSAAFLGLGFLASGAKGTDNVAAVRAICELYDTSDVFGSSVWATEHSVATSFGPDRGEFDYVNHQLENAPDDAIISLVADSYNVFNFTENVICSDELLEKIKARKGRTVLRPDSGEPKEIVLKMLEILGGKVGYTMKNGYKILNHNIGILQGDGMDIVSMPELYDHIMLNGWHPTNLVVGSGGGLLQKWNRDSLRFAIKASYGERIIDEVIVPFNIFKDPITANTGKDTKASKTGMFKVQGGMTISSATTDPIMFNSYVDDMKTVFDFGVVPKEHLDFGKVQERGYAA